ncbi:type III restriction endonuclease subunit R [Brevibacterium aurantiacum]|uniref:DEAD/DEAH box helicase n=1 Tax=Brevibacterium aurantiacum TaxID=273384 RepID=UPI000DF183FF|nr:DEAD/DEAH box helicase family protein [Brevibacterium aurantiacum]RCS91641.1 type III restriction endonuclease subunit R [Brevibacterium aurantiacum]
MRFTLKDYQSDAVGDTLRELASARDFYRSASRRVSSVALASTTGSGKTIMAAAVIEALFWGSDDFDIPSDPNAVVLWFSDDPSLNQQTLHRLQQASDRLRNRLITVEHPFRYAKLQPGNVYFINTSKLSRSSLLVRGHDSADILPGLDSHPDTVPFTFWDTLRNTIEDPNVTLYMVLDEAHRGMGRRSTSDTPTIVKRLINGHSGVPPIPIVWGISATVQRFEESMEEAQVQDSRVHLRTVAVDPVRIQESGLLKDDIVLDFPSETGDFNTVLLRRGVRKVKAMSTAWSEYASEQSEPEAVKPLLVLQVPNKPSPTEVAAAIDSIYEEWPELGHDAIAHVFGEHKTQSFGPHSVPYISPERVQDATYIRVLLAKDAISTGWDCPRAEVMVSFRPAKDETHITQLLGRMIRTPLARRVEGDDLLNSVECILPKFNRTTASLVLEKIMGSEVLGGEDDTGKRVLIDPLLMTPNPAVPDEVWELFSELPTETLPRKHANPIKRLTSLAHALAADALEPDAGALAHERLHGVLNGLAAQYPNELSKAQRGVLTVAGGTVRGHRGLRTDGEWTEDADDRAIQDAYRHGARTITPDVARTYIDHLAEDTDDEDVLRDAHVRVAALAMLPQTRPALDAAAETLAGEWLGKHRVSIKGLPEARQSLFAEITAMSTDPQLVAMAQPKNRQEETKRFVGDVAQLLERRPLHLLSDEEGMFPIGKLNPDEIEVLDTEVARGNLLAWYRNPTGGRDSMSIAYQDKHGVWRTLRPDFLFFIDSPEGVQANIVDPHGAWLPDALAKLRGMARFAEAYGDHFHRLESISRVDGKLKVLDFTMPKTCAQVLEAIDADTAYRECSVEY